MTKTVEELKSMTTEELVRYAQELQEQIESEKKNTQYTYESYKELRDLYDAMRDSLMNLLKLTDREKRPY